MIDRQQHVPHLNINPKLEAKPDELFSQSNLRETKQQGCPIQLRRYLSERTSRGPPRIPLHESIDDVALLDVIPMEIAA